jgi:hypothetical protein
VPSGRQRCADTPGSIGIVAGTAIGDVGLVARWDVFDASHPVDITKDQDLELVEAQPGLTHVVEQASRTGGDNVDAASDPGRSEDILAGQRRWQRCCLDIGGLGEAHLGDATQPGGVEMKA